MCETKLSEKHKFDNENIRGRKIGYIYAGQGSQVPHMGLDFYNSSISAKKFYDSVDKSLDLKRLSFEADEDELVKTENTQVVLIGFQVMLTKLFNENNIVPNAVCGLSIGEYGALYCSGVLNEEDVLKISKFRGTEMSKCSEGINTEMYAIINSSEQYINAVLEIYNSTEKFVQISNINSKEQIVISGDKDVLEKVKLHLKKDGVRYIKLKVSGAFHTAYMDRAAESLEKYFKTIEFSEPKIPVYYNVTGSKEDEGNIKNLMVKQVKSTVRFEDDIKNMIEDGIDLFIEIGFNNIIKKIVRKINSNVQVISISSYEDFKDLVEKFYE
ncbi:ACP S-malonyltransferase [Peptoniphilus sp. oral taxon 386]|uniref:ACP S-malonyltransferase n=1 Tax=Peptoniphilus sp. oral taxon 386 TaxID=652713 RepID=UPI0001DA9CFD|nr:ACP S-malonyltransferase [Peptoniphilus sp. oral taxon 386]EFI42469.1 putative [acyl-carrier-protein] S-malonyltransferase [Peptoniphilus sp. oral taxon 386 str. F0131]